MPPDENNAPGKRADDIDRESLLYRCCGSDASYLKERQAIDRRRREDIIRNMSFCAARDRQSTEDSKIDRLTRQVTMLTELVHLLVEERSHDTFTFVFHPRFIERLSECLLEHQQHFRPIFSELAKTQRKSKVEPTPTPKDNMEAPQSAGKATNNDDAIRQGNGQTSQATQATRRDFGTSPQRQR